jgi:glycolate dehydrogenase iron-sulfur subunit
MASAMGFSGPDRPSSDVINTCVHCGLCLSSCPTYRETGLEMSSPRGRIFLMKAVDDGRIGLDSPVFQGQMAECLNCRACEAVCPSGVRYGAILEASRAQVEAVVGGRRPLGGRLVRRVVFGHLFKRMGLFRAFSRALWLYQRSGLQGLVRKSGLLGPLGLREQEAMLPAVSRRFVVPRGQVLPAEGERRLSVALLSGCIMSTAFAHVHEATIRVLRRNGCEVWLPAGQGCCGALHVHGGDLEGGRELARRNVVAFDRAGLDAVVVNAAGCGSHLKEVGHLLQADPAWAERARAFAAKVRDVHELLAGLELDRAGLGPLPARVTYQEPCHLAHAQRIGAQPRALLRAIPGLELREMREASLCCGSAGIYNVTQPEMAARLGARKVDNALATGAEVIATANPGCALQLAAELRRRGSWVGVRSVVELLDEAYRRGRGE